MCRLGCMNAFGPACANEKSVQAHDNSAMNIFLLESVTKNTVVLDNWETHIEPRRGRALELKVGIAADHLKIFRPIELISARSECRTYQSRRSCAHAEPSKLVRE